MNIEELFDNEKWAGYGMLTTEDANLAIDYLKTEVMEYVEGLDKRIAELEARLENAAEEAEALRRFRAECAMLKIVPTTVRTEWYGRM